MINNKSKYKRYKNNLLSVKVKILNNHRIYKKVVMIV